MGKSSQPSPPDTTAAAWQQGELSNQNTGNAFALSNPNTSSVYGSTTYSNPQLDQYNQQMQQWMAGGKHGDAPIYPTLTPGSTTMTTTLSPQQQALFNAQQGALGTLAGGVQGLAGQVAQNPNSINLTGLPNASQGASDIQGNVVNALYGQQKALLDPQWQQTQQSLESQLAAEGLQPGTQAYQNAMTNFANQKQQAYQSAMDSATGQGTQAGYLAQQENIAGANQGIQQQMLQQQFPMSQLQALLGMTQPQGPAMQGTSGAGVAQTPDLLNAMEQQYQNSLASSNASNAQFGNTLGTLGQLGMMAALLA